MEKIQGEWIVKSHSEIENLEMLRQSLKDNIDLMGLTCPQLVSQNLS